MKRIFSILFMAMVMFLASAKVDAADYNQVLAYHILVPTEAQALELKSEIEAAETRGKVFSNFTSAARKYSKCPSGADGGKLGWFGKGEMVKPFEDAAFSIKDGTVSEPVKTQFGYHLIYVVSKK